MHRWNVPLSRALLALPVTLLAVGCQEARIDNERLERIALWLEGYPRSASSESALPGYRDYRPLVEIVAMRMGSLPVLIPSTVVLTSGATATLSVTNDAGHEARFRIESLGVDRRVAPGSTLEIDLPRVDAGSIHGVRMQEVAQADPPPAATSYSSTAVPEARATLIILAAREPQPDP